MMNKEALRQALLFYVNTVFGGIAAGLFALGFNFFFQSNALLYYLTDSGKSMLFFIFGSIVLVCGILVTYFAHTATVK